MPDPVPLFQDTRWMIATALAGWGAILSTAQLVLKLLEGKTAVRVAFGEILSASATPTTGTIAIRAFNIGRTDVTFPKACCWVVFRGDADYTIGIPDDWAESALPVTVKPRNAILFRVVISEMTKLVDVPPGHHVTPTMMKAIVIDAIGNQYETRWETLVKK